MQTDLFGHIEKSKTDISLELAKEIKSLKAMLFIITGLIGISIIGLLIKLVL
jgi:hypothetical protein